MGIIIKQSIRGSFWSYFGVIIGFITTSYLYPNYLTTDLVGLFGLLVAYSTLFGNFSLLGIQSVTARLFPLFRDKQYGHHGFLPIALLVMAAGFSLFLIVYSVFSPLLIESNAEKSKIFSEYIYLLVPLTFFTMAFTFFDSYNKVLYNAVFGIFLQEFLQRLLILSVILLYVFHLISVSQLIIGYASAVCLKGIVILIFLIAKKEVHLKPQFNFVSKTLKKEMIDVALFSILGGLGSMIVFNIDKILVNQLLDLGNTGVYTIAFYFGTLVVIPSRPLQKISGTLIADAWMKNDLGTIRDIYYKSCITQFVIGGFLFTGIWTNIDNIITILGNDYLQSRWVIFFIGIGYLFDMLTGANALVIAYSKYYRISLVFTSILIVTVVILLYLLIPALGITGAAIAIAGALFLNNLMRYIFLFKKYRFQPFSLRFLFIALIFLFIYTAISFIPRMPLIPDILVRGTVAAALSFLAFWFLPVSDEVKGLLKTIIGKLKKT